MTTWRDGNTTAESVAGKVPAESTALTIRRNDELEHVSWLDY